MATRKDITTLIKAVNLNDHARLRESLMSTAKIKVIKGTTLERTMLGLYNRNPKLFFAVIKQVPYNPKADNITTSAVFKKALLKDMGRPANGGRPKSTAVKAREVLHELKQQKRVSSQGEPVAQGRDWFKEWKEEFFGKGL